MDSDEREVAEALAEWLGNGDERIKVGGHDSDVTMKLGRARSAFVEPGALASLSGDQFDIYIVARRVATVG